MKERWKVIPSYPGYEVSDRGRVRSFWRKGPLVHGEKRIANVSQRVMTQRKEFWRCRNGTHHKTEFYWRISLRKGNALKKFFVHQLVLLAFTGSIPKQTRHFDNNGRNNRLSNLRHGDASSNAEDRRRHGTLLCGSKQWKSKLTAQQVQKIIRQLKHGVSRHELARRHRVTFQAIDNIWKGRTWNWLTKRKRGVLCLTSLK